MAPDDWPTRPQCARRGCPFLAHSNPNAYAREMGWENFCCNACAEGLDHGVRCERLPAAGGAAAAAEPLAAVVPATRASVDADPDNSELVWKAVSDLVISVEHLETEYEAPKLEKKLRDYLKKSAKNLEFFRKPWEQLVNDYADAVYEMLFQGLFGRDWLMQGEADFLLCLDAGIRECWPPSVLEGVPRSAFEHAVLVAHDRAFEEQRYLPILDETVKRFVEGQKLRKKLIAAGEDGRRSAAAYGVCPDGPDEIEEFVVRWIDATIARLAQDTQGELDWCMQEDVAVQFFTALMEADAVPVALTKAHAPPREGWSFIYSAVAKAYAAHNGRQVAKAYAAHNGRQAGGAQGGSWANKGKRKAAAMQGGWDAWWGYKEQNLPQCASPGCPFRAHSNPNYYAKERGWDIYCCNACVESGSHGPRCEQVLFGSDANGGAAGGDHAQGW